MSKKDDGGPAFGGAYPGVSLRDYFAAAVLPAVYADVPDGTEHDVIAMKAYGMADAMLEARKK
jgi:hypothetical protein